MAAKYDHIDFTPPSGVRSEAKKGLAWRREFGRGGTAIGIARARDLGNGTKISPSTARRMKAFFDRHQSDKTGEGWSPGEKGFPSNGRIAHALWGGDAGYAWSRKLVKQMNTADERSIASRVEELKAFVDDRAFCPKGKGGGIDNSCGKNKSGGGGDTGESSGGGGWGPPPPRKVDETTITAKDIAAGRKPGDVVDFYGAPAKLISAEEANAKAAAAEKEAKDLGFSRGSAEKVDHPSQVGEGSYVHIKDKTGAEIIGEVAHWKPSADGSQYDAVVMVPGRGKDNDLQRPVSIDVKPGAAIHKVSRVNAPTWKPKSGKKMKPSKAKHGPSYLHTKLRSKEPEMQIETRSLCLDDFSDDDAFPLLSVETRCSDNGEKEEQWVVGYAARFGVNSLKMDDFYERIDPSAFGIVTERRGRKSPLETRALFNHDPNVVLGRFPNTLRMKVDEHGLRYEILMPESRSDIVELIRRGDIRGSSFSFVVAPGGEDWSVEEGRSIRTVKRIASLVDVGPVTFPAYPDASVSVAKRSYQEFMRRRSTPRKAIDDVVARRVAELRKFMQERNR